MLGFSVGALLAGIFYGFVGLYYFRLAKREGNIPLLLLSLALFIYPYFVDNAYASWGLGAVLTVLAHRSAQQ